MRLGRWGARYIGRCDILDFEKGVPYLVRDIYGEWVEVERDGLHRAVRGVMRYREIGETSGHSPQWAYERVHKGMRQLRGSIDNW